MYYARVVVVVEVNAEQCKNQSREKGKEREEKKKKGSEKRLLAYEVVTSTRQWIPRRRKEWAGRCCRDSTQFHSYLSWKEKKKKRKQKQGGEQ